MTPKEKARLVRFATGLGKALDQMVTIVHPDTVRRWIREAKQTGKKQTLVPRGRPRIKITIRDLILRFARENAWGYTRIMGELKKLYLTPPSKNTVKRILREAGKRTPGPCPFFARPGQFPAVMAAELGWSGPRRVGMRRGQPRRSRRTASGGDSVSVSRGPLWTRGGVWPH